MIPSFGTMTDLAASSPVPFGATVRSTPLVPSNSPLTQEALSAFVTGDGVSGSKSQGHQGPPTPEMRLQAMAAQARAVEAKRSIGWSKLTSIIPQVQCGMAYINQNPFFNRGYVQVGMMNEAPIDGKIVGEFPCASASTNRTKARANHLGGKPPSALWWPHGWHGQEGRYGASPSPTHPPVWSSGKSAMPQYVAGRSGYMVDPWGAAHLN